MLALLAIALLAPPSLRIDCPEYVARPTWDALSDALRAWKVPDVNVDVRCGRQGGGSVETRLRGQMAYAELSSDELDGPDTLVEIVAWQVDTLTSVAGEGLRRQPAPRWAFRVALGGRAMDTRLFQGTLALEVDRLLGRYAFARVGLEAGMGGGFEAAGRDGQTLTTSGLVMIGVRRADAITVDGGIGARLGWAVLQNGAGTAARPADAVGTWAGPVAQVGGEVGLWQRGALRVAAETGWSAAGPEGRVDGVRVAHLNRWWLGLCGAIAMRF